MQLLILLFCNTWYDMWRRAGQSLMNLMAVSDSVGRSVLLNLSCLRLLQSALLWLPEIRPQFLALSSSKSDFVFGSYWEALQQQQLCHMRGSTAARVASLELCVNCLCWHSNHISPSSPVQTISNAVTVKSDEIMKTDSLLYFRINFIPLVRHMNFHWSLLNSFE